VNRRAFPHAVALLLFATSAHAVDPPPDAATTQMREQFRDGVKAYDAKDYAHALDDFRAAYAAKPSPIIKQNIALCLRALGRNVEAVDTLQSMLAEGGATLKPQARDLAAKAIAEMLATIATVKIAVNVPAAPKGAKVAFDVFVDDEPVPADKRDVPLRLDPGSHRFRAHADGFFDAVKDVVLSAGQRDIVVALDLSMKETAPRYGVLRVRASSADAMTAVDADAPRPGGGPFNLAAGKHRISVTAPGFVSYVADVVVVASETTDVVVNLEPLAPPPPRLPGPSAPLPARARRIYIIGGISVQSEALTLSHYLDEPSSGGRHQFSGAAGVFEVGRTSKYIDVGVLAELGVMTVHSYQSPNETNQAARVNVVDWVLAPELRIHSAGRVHAVGGVAVGLEGSILSAILGESSGTPSQTNGSGAGLMALLEAGLGVDLERTRLEGTVFVDAHDVRGVKEDGQRLLLDSPAVRGGVRLSLGYRF
jgi:hypothetical protein